MESPTTRRSKKSIARSELAARLKQARLNCKMSQEQLAAVLGRNQRYVSRVETGEQRLDILEFLLMCRALRQDAPAVIRHFAALAND
jgi:transcriptional regulator with XRE-family HTH domain